MNLKNKSSLAYKTWRSGGWIK